MRPIIKYANPILTSIKNHTLVVLSRLNVESIGSLYEVLNSKVGNMTALIAKENFFLQALLNLSVQF